MFVCKRTEEVVKVSDNPKYLFQSITLDEDLYLSEVYLSVSKTAKEEAETLELESIPKNFSHNRELVKAVKDLDTRAVLKAVDNNTRPLEYCEAVLVYFHFYC